MNVEEKLKKASTDAMIYGTIVSGSGSITMQKQTVVKMTDAISICKEACKKQREICKSTFITDAGVYDLQFREPFDLERIAVGIGNAPEPSDL